MKKIILAGLGISFLTSCGFFDMPGTTAEMRDTTNKYMPKMSDNTEALTRQTDELLKLMNTVYSDGRQTSIKVAMEAFDLMRRARSQSGKVALAAVFFKGWEYQLERPDGDSDDKPWREATIEEAVAFFLRSVHEFGPAKTVKVLGKTVVVEPEIVLPIYARRINVVLDQDSNALSLKALAITMHMLNNKQKILEKRNPDYETASMLDIIEDALLRKVDPANVDLEEFEDAVLEWEETALYLLNLRASSIQLLAINEMSRGAFITVSGIIPKPKLIDWTFHHKTYNNGKLKAIRKRLKEVVRLKEFLNKPELGFRYIPDEALPIVWSKLQPIQMSLDETPRNVILNDINEYLKQL